MSSSSAITPSPRNGSETPQLAPSRWLKNPSYPERTHYPERAGLEAILKSCDEKLGATRKKLVLLTNHPKRADYEKLFHQMQGARDQLADVVLRMPREAGELYHEDHERLEIAEKAFSWLLRRWEAIAS